MTAAGPAADDLEHLSAQELIAEAVARYPRVAVATSFQKEASVILDLVMNVDPGPCASSRSTPACCFPRRARRGRALEERYGIEIEGVRGTRWTATGSAAPTAAASCARSRPLRDTLAGADAWITGLRREQSARRAGTPKLDVGRKHGLWKLNPLADWTERDVWRYIAANDVPYHPLHDRGYDVDRLLAVHAARRRARGPLGGRGQGRVRHPRRGIATKAH